MTGGHAASTAFVVAEEIKRQEKPWEIYWIGMRSSLEGTRQKPLSSLYFPKRGIRTYELISGRLQRKFTLHTLPALFKIPFGFIHALILVTKIRPNVVLSFGGFSAFPVVLMSYILGIPIIIHEQTAVAGRANRLSALFAKKIAISRISSHKFFPKWKTVLTGNPTPKEITRDQASERMPKEPLLMITGGQSGSVAINDVTEKILPELIEKFRVVHLTGVNQEKKFKLFEETFDGQKPGKYEVYGIVDPKKYNKLFNSAHIVLSRAGANTVSKIIAAKKPAILVPLPISYLEEQKRNALFAEEFGVARVVYQDKLTPQRLLEEIGYVFDNWGKIKKRVTLKQSPDENAGEKVVNLIGSFVK